MGNTCCAAAVNVNEHDWKSTRQIVASPVKLKEKEREKNFEILKESTGKFSNNFVSVFEATNASYQWESNNNTQKKNSKIRFNKESYMTSKRASNRASQKKQPVFSAQKKKDVRFTPKMQKTTFNKMYATQNGVALYDLIKAEQEWSDSQTSPACDQLILNQLFSSQQTRNATTTTSSFLPPMTGSMISKHSVHQTPPMLQSPGDKQLRSLPNSMSFDNLSARQQQDIKILYYSFQQMPQPVRRRSGDNSIHPEMTDPAEPSEPYGSSSTMPLVYHQSASKFAEQSSMEVEDGEQNIRNISIRSSSVNQDLNANKNYCQVISDDGSQSIQEYDFENCVDVSNVLIDAEDSGMIGSEQGQNNNHLTSVEPTFPIDGRQSRRGDKKYSNDTQDNIIYYQDDEEDDELLQKEIMIEYQFQSPDNMHNNRSQYTNNEQKNADEADLIEQINRFSGLTTENNEIDQQASSREYNQQTNDIVKSTNSTNLFSPQLKQCLEDDKEKQIHELQKSIQNIEQQLMRMQQTERQNKNYVNSTLITIPNLQSKSQDDLQYEFKMKKGTIHIQDQQDVVHSLLEEVGAQRKKLGSIFNITERNEESEITGGTNSLLSNMLKGENEDHLKSQSLLSGQLNLSTIHQHIALEDELSASYNKLKFLSGTSKE